MKAREQEADTESDAWRVRMSTSGLPACVEAGRPLIYSTSHVSSGTGSATCAAVESRTCNKGARVYVHGCARECA